MKKILLLLMLSMTTVSLFAQDDEYQKYLESLKKEQDAEMQKLSNEFSDFKAKANAEFADFVAKEWALFEEFKTQELSMYNILAITNIEIRLFVFLSKYNCLKSPFFQFECRYSAWIFRIPYILFGLTIQICYVLPCREVLDGTDSLQMPALRRGSQYG